ncbi:MAG: hypothetical protein WC242_00115 [Candidatus Paceibacterota bacterium]|jgi:hypothetical protein
MPRKGSGTAVLGPETQEIIDAVKVSPLSTLYNMFRDVEQLRVRYATRQTHLGKK